MCYIDQSLQEDDNIVCENKYTTNIHCCINVSVIPDILVNLVKLNCSGTS